MSTLEERFELGPQDEKLFARMRKECEANVVRWEYWLTPKWHWDPEYIVNYLNSPKRALKETANYLYGYDSKGRVVFFQTMEPDESAQFDLLIYKNDTLFGMKFLGVDILTCVFEAQLNEGRVVRLDLLDSDEPAWKTITWKNGKVFQISAGNQYEPKGLVVIKTTYDEKGKVVSEVELLNIKEKPLPKGATLKSLGCELHKRSLQAVVKTLAKLKLKKPVYCLTLSYDCEGNPIMPPMLGIGLDSERQTRMKKGGKDAKLDIWDPEQMSLFAKVKTDEVIFGDKKLQKVCGYYNRLLNKKGDNAPAQKLLNKVAAELGRMDWTGKLTTTDDFIAYAVDTYLSDLQKNLKQSVPADRLKKLKAAKMV